MDRFRVSVTPAATTTINTTTAAAAAVSVEKPYHAKRPHRKSRTGCRNCKTRKVKCDEGRPACRACVARRESCVYLVVVPKGSRAAVASSAVVAPQVVREPLFIPSGHDMVDMRLLWFYTAATYSCFSTGQMKERSVDDILKVNIPQLAFGHRFLMDCVLGLAAMHANFLGLRHMGVSRSRELLYRARAFEAYRKAVGAADPATFPALVACSLLLCGLATHVFRGEDARQLAILDWIVLWRGINSILDGTPPHRLRRIGIGPLVYRPSVDLDASARHVPSLLLHMVASTGPEDPEFALVEPYYLALKYLGSLYRELANGFSQVLLLRVSTYFTFVPKEFVDAARARRPRALVIIAHYLVFTKIRVQTCWWMDGISELEIPSICAYLGPEWADLLRVPQAALELSDATDLARLLLDDPSWESPVDMPEYPLMVPHESERAVRAAARVEELADDAQDYDECAVRPLHC